ncbi:hypothetical protein [Mucilaginibacter sp.]|uniref:hypothetical protein n=1 Tax=Mucilaginibacter sp. TaxID=1882438 RepID=UPI003D10301F
MNSKMTFIYRIAFTLSRCKKKTITAKELAKKLNSYGFLTGYGTAYKGGRGTYTLIKATYKAAKKVLGKAQADLIANSFTKSNGGFAWDK